jgi:hypothetical protein
MLGKLYVKLVLPLAKTAAPGETQSVFMTKRRNLCPIAALRNLANIVLVAHGWGTSFGHFFRIGGASFFLVMKVNPEIVHIAERWKSLAYKTYIQAF